MSFYVSVNGVCMFVCVSVGCVYASFCHCQWGVYISIWECRVCVGLFM